MSSSQQCPGRWQCRARGPIPPPHWVGGQQPTRSTRQVIVSIPCRSMSSSTASTAARLACRQEMAWRVVLMCWRLWLRSWFRCWRLWDRLVARASVLDAPPAPRHRSGSRRTGSGCRCRPRAFPRTTSSEPASAAMGRLHRLQGENRDPRRLTIQLQKKARPSGKFINALAR